uniref:Uncharacterized protein n=1 Tax=Pristionchus pacificus TaxID=54126 RepID=A0A2A6CEN1_PRIPA|eukprot:PDM76538.1 hypothetical protein PRIPAC_42904 [Pristionchus pacificus]
MGRTTELVRTTLEEHSERVFVLEDFMTASKMFILREISLNSNFYFEVMDYEEMSGMKKRRLSNRN